MGSNRSALGWAVPLLVLTVVSSVLVSAGVSRADAATCGWLNRGSGAPAGGGELSVVPSPNQVAERLQKANGTFAAQKTILTLKSGRTIAVGDVNGDNNPDVYVVGGKVGSDNAPDYLLLGNATGSPFTQRAIPQTTIGGGNRVYPIDYTRDGLTSFLVLNGQTPNCGPIQLLTPQPPSLSKLTRTVSFQSGAAW